MTGWLPLLVLAAIAFAGLWLLRLRGPMLQLGAAALLFGCAGYALQGHPGLAGSPRAAPPTEPPLSLAAARHAFFGDFSGTEHWLLLSESFARRGNAEDSVGVLKSAVREHPNDLQLWVGLGNALVDFAGGLTPASEFAFRRAAELAPGHPAPAFFMGLALARSGDRDDAIVLWKDILADAPADAPWRPMVEDAVRVLDRPPEG